MNSIALFFETKSGKYLKNFIVGVGASIVLVGALAKLQHWPIANFMLPVGMFTEAFIFALLGILPPVKDYYWERYYPNLDENPHVEAYRKGVKFQIPAAPLGANSGGNLGATASLDKMLEEAQINPTNLKRLNENFNRFGDTVEQMKDITEVTAATGAYTTAARETATALGEMKTTFQGATQTMNVFNGAAEDAAHFHNQVSVLTQNLGQLNQIYEVELQDANNHLKAMNRFYSTLLNASDSMAASAEDAQAARDQIGALARNLTNLNSIYGNMLAAMQGR
ncbi:MAG: gliding motility protein GldL [Bacteroidetes bacterium]|nr:gliding motility protein GldL [Bacteroidota bacterium]MBS1628467.1 gliding motility protein GldL [Bacteroidota bacterium]